MPVWWSCFAFAIAISAVGMMVYKNKIKSKLLFTGSKVKTDKYDMKSINLFFALVSFTLLIYFVGQRSWIFDTSDYQYAYNNYYTTELSQISDIWNGTIKGKGKLYMTILVMFKHYSGGADYNAWFTFLATVQCMSVALFLYKYAENFLFSMYLFFAASTFIWLVNGMRQFLAVTIVVFFY